MIRSVYKKNSITSATSQPSHKRPRSESGNTSMSTRKKVKKEELSGTNDNIELPAINAIQEQEVVSESKKGKILPSLTPKIEKTLALIVQKEVFADPTLDVAFKMLFGQEQNRDILINLLNNLLNFKGKEEITDIEISNNELIVAQMSEQGQPGIAGAVDILCINKGKQKIAIEIQGQKQPYFLARMQEYMSKIISSQVKKGDGALYHEKILKTYILVIGKNNLFVGDTELKDQEQFEITVVPTVKETGEEVPGNKMCWKYYELQKFRDSENYKNINANSPIKDQWLEFLLDCSKKSSSPTDRAKLIQKGYEIMKMTSWTTDQKNAYDRAKQKEEDDAAQIQIKADQARKEGLEEGLQKGLAEGETKGEIKLVKTMCDIMSIQTPTKLMNSISRLNKPQVEHIIKNISKSVTNLFEEISGLEANQEKNQADSVSTTSSEQQYEMQVSLSGTSLIDNGNGADSNSQDM
ncbi:MAG: Rpn family recombination-promoting nuclease/putative transposase [Rickettsiaceae bacterium]|nr:MAG: Rpn family recombination-promoting nuclease/putative transposase [Rickettsiaceae bacterium]